MGSWFRTAVLVAKLAGDLIGALNTETVKERLKKTRRLADRRLAAAVYRKDSSRLRQMGPIIKASGLKPE